MTIYDSINSKFGKSVSLFYFTANKNVLIKDWRLGLMLRMIQLCIIAYGLYDVIVKASYLKQEVPGAAVSVSIQQTESEYLNAFPTNIQKFKNGEFKYCNEPKLYEIEKENIKFKNIKCMFSDMTSLSTFGDTRFFLPTYFKMQKHYAIVKEDESECPKPGTEGLPKEAKLLFFMLNTCYYVSSHDYFVTNAEDTTIEIYHSYYTCLIGKSGSLPKTIVKGHHYGTKEIEIQSGHKIKLKLKDVLDLIGVDLDLRLNEQSNHPMNDLTVAGTDENNTLIFPFARISGVNLIMKFQYFQYNLAPEEYKKLFGSELEDGLCIIEISPKYMWTRLPTTGIYMLNNFKDPFILHSDMDINEYNNSQVSGLEINLINYGINLSFQISGNLGIFSIGALVNAIVSLWVLLNVAQIIVTLFAVHCLGLSSKLYTEFLQECVDWRKEYARYASQALVAGFVFMNYDCNKSWKLDRKEIYYSLKNILKRSLKRQQIACLTDFLMRQGSCDDVAQKGECNLTRGDVPVNNLISVGEWIDIFTDEKITLAALVRLIDSEYKDENTINYLLGLAEGNKVNLDDSDADFELGSRHGLIENNKFRKALSAPVNHDH